MTLVFIQITQVWVHYFKSLNRVQSTQDEKARLIKGDELKLTQTELFSLLFFKERMMLKKSKLKTGNIAEITEKFYSPKREINILM